MTVDFSFSEEQQAVRALARELLEAEATPARIHAAERSSAWRDDELWKRAAAANLLGLAIPEKFGGMGLGFAELCVLLEEVGRACVPGPWFPTLAQGALALAKFGSDAQQAEWLPKIAAGEAFMSPALREANDARRFGRVPSVPDTTVKNWAQGYGGIPEVSGLKREVSCANNAHAFLVPVTERVITSPPPRARVYLLPAKLAQREREQVLSTGEPVADVCFRRSQLIPPGVDYARDGKASLDSRAIPPDPHFILPCEHDDFLWWMRTHSLVALAAMQLGVVTRAIEITAAYAREREQFGVPIGSFQAVQHRLADAFIARDVLRWTTWSAVFQLANAREGGGGVADDDHAVCHNATSSSRAREGGGGDADDHAVCHNATSSSRVRAAQVAGYWAAEAGARVTAACVHLHGGTGADISYPIHRYFLWAKSLELQVGGAQARLAALGDDLARRGLEPQPRESEARAKKASA